MVGDRPAAGDGFTLLHVDHDRGGVDLDSGHARGRRMCEHSAAWLDGERGSGRMERLIAAVAVEVVEEGCRGERAAAGGASAQAGGHMEGCGKRIAADVGHTVAEVDRDAVGDVEADVIATIARDRLV